MNAVTKVEPQEVSTSDATSIMEVISRAASDPNMDVAKLDQLFTLRERMLAVEAEQAFNEAMSACQAAMRPIATDAANPQTKSRYASYGALDKAVRPIYTTHGFSLSFYSGDGAPAEHVRVACKVARGRHSERPHIDMPADGKGAKGGDVMTKTHAAGSAFSYGQRYLLKMIFNIAVGDDDDGNSNGGRDQSAAATAAISAINLCTTVDEIRAWKAKNAEGLAALPTAEADEVVRLFNSRFNKLKGADQ